MRRPRAVRLESPPDATGTVGGGLYARGMAPEPRVPQPPLNGSGRPSPIPARTRVRQTPEDAPPRPDPPNPLPTAVIGSLSPSRAADFLNCPLKYRFRVIDRLDETPSRAATRGTLVHAVLERLFDHPPADRNVASATALLIPEWAQLLEAEPALLTLFEGAEEGESDEWLASAGRLLETYFAMEDPTVLEPAARELFVTYLLDNGLEIRGIIDRLDAAANGALRVVDYKTGRAPGEGFEASALFQMKFYALLLLRTRGVVPRQLKLLYLAGGESLTYEPDADELDSFERKVRALWDAIRKAETSGDWRPKKSKLCGWCDHQALCPEWGGTPPPLPRSDLRIGVAAGP